VERVPGEQAAVTNEVIGVCGGGLLPAAQRWQCVERMVKALVVGIFSDKAVAVAEVADVQVVGSAILSFEVVEGRCPFTHATAQGLVLVIGGEITFTVIHIATDQ